MSKPPGEIPLPPGEGVGNGGSRGDSRDPIAAEIQAEIADHLATAAEKLQSQGLPTAEARQKSQAKFGDPATIGRRCYWIKQGDALMFRTAIIVLLSLLCVALGLVAFSGYRSQRQMAEQMAALAEQLKVLADQQRFAAAPTSPAEPKPLEITGKVFVGSPDKPAPNTEVTISQLGDGKTVRRVLSDSTGSFSSGPLAAGDYTLLAPVSGGSPSRMSVQSAPFYVYPSTPHAEAQIDVAFHAGRIRVELSRPLPKVVLEDKYTIDSRLFLAVLASGAQIRPWTAARPMPERFPLYVDTTWIRPERSAFGGHINWQRSVVLSNAEIEAQTPVRFLGEESRIPSGHCSVMAVVFTDILPANFAASSDRPSSAASSNRHSNSETYHWLTSEYLFRYPAGAAWLAKLRGWNSPSSSEFPGFELPRLQTGFQNSSDIEIPDGTLVRLHVEVPDAVEQLIGRLPDATTDPLEFAELARRDNPFIQPAKITLLGTEPLKPDDTTTSR